MTDPDLSLVIVSYNSAGIIERCQAPLLHAAPFPTFIIDNASPDGSACALKEKFPKIDVIALSQNVGYGRAANVGLRKVETPYALLLNPDLTATETDIRKLMAHAIGDTSKTAIWGPASDKDAFANELPRSVTWISGCAMLFDVERIKRIGLFDENIFLFSEEDELCDRTLNAGYGIRFCPDVYFEHLVGQACAPSPQIEYMKWWHFGWSNCYRLTKSKRSTPWRNPRRKMISYRIHSLISTKPEKRFKWKAKADGSKAFLMGEMAFDKDGRAQHSNF